MKGIDKNMRLVINEKVFDSKEFKGTEAELLEQLVYEFLNINSVVMMERLAVVYEMLIGYIKDVLGIQEDPPFKFDDIESDREKLEIVIEQYKFAKFLSSRYKGSYESYLDLLEQYEVFSKDKAIMTLIDYKLVEDIKEYLDKALYIIDDDFIFRHQKTSYTAKFKKVVLKVLKKDLRIHDLRHSHASFLINNGVDILLISQRLGHSNIAMTLNVYSHLYPSKENEAIELINKLKGV